MVQQIVYVFQWAVVVIARVNTGKVVSILEPSPRRDAIVGVLLQPAVALSTGRSSSTAAPTPAATAAAAALSSGTYEGFLMLVPLDPRLPKGLVPPQVVAKLPQELRYGVCLCSSTSKLMHHGCEA